MRLHNQMAEEVTDGDLNHQADNRINQNFILLQRLMNHQTIKQRRRFLKKQEVTFLAESHFTKIKALNRRVSSSHSSFQGRGEESTYAGQDSEA